MKKEKAERLPWFPCYPTKLLGALADMSTEEQCIYTTTLLRIYEVGGPIKADIASLAHRTRMTKKKATAAISRLKEMGKLVVLDGLLMNPTAKEELDGIRDRFQKVSTINSSKSKKRWQKHKENQSIDDAGWYAAGMPDGCCDDAETMPFDAQGSVDVDVSVSVPVSNSLLVESQLRSGLSNYLIDSDSDYRVTDSDPGRWEDGR